MAATFSDDSSSISPPRNDDEQGGEYEGGMVFQQHEISEADPIANFSSASPSPSREGINQHLSPSSGALRALDSCNWMPGTHAQAIHEEECYEMNQTEYENSTNRESAARQRLETAVTLAQGRSSNEIAAQDISASMLSPIEKEQREDEDGEDGCEAMHTGGGYRSSAPAPLWIEEGNDNGGVQRRGSGEVSPLEGLANNSPVSNASTPTRYIDRSLLQGPRSGGALHPLEMKGEQDDDEAEDFSHGDGLVGDLAALPSTAAPWNNSSVIDSSSMSHLPNRNYARSPENSPRGPRASDFQGVGSPSQIENLKQEGQQHKNHHHQHHSTQPHLGEDFSSLPPNPAAIDLKEHDDDVGIGADAPPPSDLYARLGLLGGGTGAEEPRAQNDQVDGGAGVKGQQNNDTSHVDPFAAVGHIQQQGQEHTLVVVSEEARGGPEDSRLGGRSRAPAPVPGVYDEPHQEEGESYPSTLPPSAKGLDSHHFSPDEGPHRRASRREETLEHGTTCKGEVENLNHYVNSSSSSGVYRIPLGGRGGLGGVNIRRRADVAHHSPDRIVVSSDSSTFNMLSPEEETTAAATHDNDGLAREYDVLRREQAAREEKAKLELIAEMQEIERQKKLREDQPVVFASVISSLKQEAETVKKQPLQGNSGVALQRELDRKLAEEEAARRREAEHPVVSGESNPLSRFQLPKIQPSTSFMQAMDALVADHKDRLKRDAEMRVSIVKNLASEVVKATDEAAGAARSYPEKMVEASDHQTILPWKPFAQTHTAQALKELPVVVTNRQGNQHHVTSPPKQRNYLEAYREAIQSGSLTPIAKPSTLSEPTDPETAALSPSEKAEKIIEKFKQRHRKLGLTTDENKPVVSDRREQREHNQRGAVSSTTSRRIFFREDGDDFSHGLSHQHYKIRQGKLPLGRPLKTPSLQHMTHPPSTLGQEKQQLHQATHRHFQSAANPSPETVVTKHSLGELLKIGGVTPLGKSGAGRGKTAVSTSSNLVLKKGAGAAQPGQFSNMSLVLQQAKRLHK